jgi:hypothetical protein
MVFYSSMRRPAHTVRSAEVAVEPSVELPAEPSVVETVKVGAAVEA